MVVGKLNELVRIMSDLSSLMTIAPTTAAGFIGMNQADDSQRQRLQNSLLGQQIESQYQKSQHDSVMNPLLQEQQRTQNKGLEAGLGSIAAKSEADALKVSKDKETYATDVAAHNAKNVGSIYAQAAKYYNTVADDVERAPDVLKKQTAYESLMKVGIPADYSRMISDRLTGLTPQAMVQHLRQEHERLIQADEKYRIEMDKQKAQAFSNEKIAKGHDDTSRSNTAAHIQGASDLEDKRIEAGKYNKEKAVKDFEGKVDAELLKASGSVKAQYAILSRAASVAIQAERPDLAAKYQTQMAAIENQVQAETSAPKPGGVDAGQLGSIPTVPTTSIRSPASGSPTPQPGATGSVSAAGRIRVVGSDGRTGTVPADQLNKALQQGYKKAQ
jgi:hypothetical protein